ncbi:MAG: glycosyltransferase family A protein [Verrucomicrobiota bacterium]
MSTETESSVILSRIVLCYKQESMLKAWLDEPSLHVEGTEWLVVNDSPAVALSDAFREICTRRNIHIVESALNLGRCNARNLGARHARGQWLDFIDGDDVPHPMPLESLEGLEAGLLLFPVVGFPPDQLPVVAQPPSVQLPWTADNILQDSLYPDYFPIDARPCGTSWRRDTFFELGGYDARFDDGWEDTQIAWHAHQRKVPIARLNYVKQSYYQGQYEAKTTRICGVSIYNFFSLVEQYGDPAMKEEYRRQKREALKSALWQSLHALRQADVLSLGFRLKVALKVLFKSWK